MKTFKDMGIEHTKGRDWQHYHGHHNHIGHKQVGKWGAGYGGINCPCCTKDNPTELKRKFSRWNRRKAKQNLLVDN